MDHQETMRTAYDRINAGDLAGFGDLIADDFVEHEEMGDASAGKVGVLEFFRGLRAAFPDLRMEVEDVIAEGDKAVVRFRATGTHQGDFSGIPATGRSVDIQGIDIMRFDAAGLVCEHWGVTDTMAMMQQLGVVPDGPPA
jgi:steroid delta-isomerase-like uncharacterized protein